MAEYDRFAWLYDVEYNNIVEDIPFYKELFKDIEDPILELGCGTGRLLIPLAKENHRVSGLDISQKMLDIAKKKLSLEPQEIIERVSLTKGDMRDFDLATSFSGILIAFNSFMHLLTIEDQDRCLENVYKHLVDRGRFIVSVVNMIPELLESSKGCYHHNSLLWIDKWHSYLQKYETRLIDSVHQIIKLNIFYDLVDRYGRVTRYVREMLLRYFTRYEMERMFIMHRFKIEALYGDYDFSSFKEDSPYMIWVVEKG
ncbi:MAG: class I SAM-dependent methyltransferase [bacterium]